VLEPAYIVAKITTLALRIGRKNRVSKLREPELAIRWRAGMIKNYHLNSI